MSQVTFEDQIAINRRAFESAREEIRRRYAGQYVAIAQGRLITASPTYDEAIAAIRQLKPVPECYLVFEADEEPVFDIVTDYSGGLTAWAKSVGK